MLGKGLVVFSTYWRLSVLVQYLFMIPTRRVERNADSYAQHSVDSLPDSIDHVSALKKIIDPDTWILYPMIVSLSGIKKNIVTRIEKNSNWL